MLVVKKMLAVLIFTVKRLKSISSQIESQIALLHLENGEIRHYCLGSIQRLESVELTVELINLF